MSQTKAQLVDAVDGSIVDADIVGLSSSKLSGTLPAVSAANLTNIPAANITGTLPAISGANLTGISTTEAASNPKVGSSSHVRQNVATGLTYNSVTGDQSLGSVSSCNSSSVYGIVVTVQCVHSSPSASHGYLGGWIYQTGKTYNEDGGYFDIKTYNQYVLHFPSIVIIPWDPSGTQSLNMYVTQSTETGTNNYFDIHVDNKLENV